MERGRGGGGGFGVSADCEHSNVSITNSFPSKTKLFLLVPPILETTRLNASESWCDSQECEFDQIEKAFVLSESRRKGGSICTKHTTFSVTPYHTCYGGDKLVIKDPKNEILIRYAFSKMRWVEAKRV